MFVRKRDPRFISNTQTEAQRQAALLAASKDQAARQRAENAAKLSNYKAADWTQVSEQVLEEMYDSEETGEDGSDAVDEEEEEEEEEEVIIERYECIVCRKTFGSEGQMDAHERSKKHTKAVYALKRQMQKENKEFDLDRDVRGWAKSKDEFTPIEEEVKEETEKKEEDDDDEEDEEEVEKIEAGKKPPPKASPPSPTPSDDNDEEDDEYVTQQQFEARVLGNTEYLAESLSNTLNITSDTEAPKPQTSKVGKAKAKRAKRAAAETDSAETTTTCVTCKQSFPSGTKMFNHLRDNPSHAKPVATTGGGKKGKGKGKRK